MNRNDVLIAGHHCGNLSESAGFEQVATLLPFDYIDANQFWFANSEFGTIPKKLNLLTYEAALRLRGSRYQLIHFLLPEVHLTFSLPSSSKIVKVGTVHLPLDVFKEQNLNKHGYVMKLRKNAFDRLDSIITLTRSNEGEIRELFPQADVKFIPHGVYDFSSFFLSQAPAEEDVLNIITVGTNFRDLEMYKALASYAKAEGRKWKFHLLGASKWRPFLIGLENVKIYPYLNEKTYLTLLSQCDIHLLPLTFATANNALLEAHSVGVPSIVSKLDSVKDYSLSTTSFFEDIHSLIESISAFESYNQSTRLKLKKTTLEEAKKFHWAEIASSLESYYQQLLDSI
jgi:hypothetical protein